MPVMPVFSRRFVLLSMALAAPLGLLGVGYHRATAVLAEGCRTALRAGGWETNESLHLALAAGFGELGWSLRTVSLLLALAAVLVAVGAVLGAGRGAGWRPWRLAFAGSVCLVTSTIAGNVVARASPGLRLIEDPWTTVGWVSAAALLAVGLGALRRGRSPEDVLRLDAARLAVGGLLGLASVSAWAMVLLSVRASTHHVLGLVDLDRAVRHAVVARSTLQAEAALALLPILILGIGSATALAVESPRGLVRDSATLKRTAVAMLLSLVGASLVGAGCWRLAAMEGWTTERILERDGIAEIELPEASFVRWTHGRGGRRLPWLPQIWIAGYGMSSPAGETRDNGPLVVAAESSSSLESLLGEIWPVEGGLRRFHLAYRDARQVEPVRDERPRVSCARVELLPMFWVPAEIPGEFRTTQIDDHFRWWSAAAGRPIARLEVAYYTGTPSHVIQHDGVQFPRAVGPLDDVAGSWWPPVFEETAHVAIVVPGPGWTFQDLLSLCADVLEEGYEAESTTFWDMHGTAEHSRPRTLICGVSPAVPAGWGWSADRPASP